VNGLRIASELISVDPLLCKGNFSAHRSSEVIDGSIVFSAALSCGDMQSERTTQFFIAPRPKGGFTVFAVIGDYGDRASGTERERSLSLTRAAAQADAPAAPGG
jgi:hypothetical protein